MMSKLIALVLALSMCLSLVSTTQAEPISALPEQRIFAGNECSFMIKDDGSLWGWGKNLFGRLGDGTETNRVTPVKIMDDVIMCIPEIGSGYAIKTDGSLWGWGNSDVLLRGVQLSPVKVADNVKQVSFHLSLLTALDTSVILKGDGTVWYYDQFHAGKKLMDDAKLAKTEDGVYQAIKNDGSLWVWGEEAYSLLGRDGDASIPLKLMDNVAAVTADSNTIFIVTSDGILWGVGRNASGRLKEAPLKQTLDIISTPVKIAEGVSSKIELTNIGLYFIKEDESLWMLEKYSKKDDAGTTVEGVTQVKVMDGVQYIDYAFNHSFIVQNNGDLWSFGSNMYGELGDGTTDAKFNPTELVRITELNEAVQILKNAVATMTDDEKLIPENRINIIRYAEEALAKVSNKKVSGSEINIDKNFVSELLNNQAQQELYSILLENDIDIGRELNKRISVTTSAKGKFTVNVDVSVLDTDVDNIQVHNGDAGVIISRHNIETAGAGNPFQVTIEPTSAEISAIGALVASTYRSKYKVSISNNKSTVTVQIPSKVGQTPGEMTVINSNGEAVTNQYNSTAGKIEFKTIESGSYMSKEGIKDFSDIQALSDQQKRAIMYLTNNGISFHNEDTTFFPSKNITRAEIAELLVRSVGSYNKNATVNFTDVSKNSWYYGGVASAYNLDILKGTSATEFEPEKLMPKVQLLAVSSRLLKNRRNVSYPKDYNKELSQFKDYASIAEWAKPDIALAARQGLIIYRTDGMLNPSSNMTRVDSALVIERLFKIIWGDY